MNNRWPKCPRCKRDNVNLIEIWSASIEWDRGDPYFNEGILAPGDPKHVEGKCNICGYQWRIRGVVQVREEWFEKE